MIGDDDDDAAGGGVRRDRHLLLEIAAYIWSFTVKPNDSICLTCCSSAASLPASVVMGSVVHTAMMSVVSTSMPSHRGCATTDSKVAFGDVMMPMKRAKRFCGAGADPDSTLVLAIWMSLWKSPQRQNTGRDQPILQHYPIRLTGSRSFLIARRKSIPDRVLGFDGVSG